MNDRENPLAGKRVRKGHRGKSSNEVTLIKQSRLFGLPAELRNAIYEMVLIQPDPIRVKLKPVRVNKTARLVVYSIVIPPLLATCRSVRDETVKMFFSANTFAFPAPAYLAKSPISFTNMTTYIPLMKKIELKIGHSMSCRNDHIYKFDMTGGMARLMQPIRLENSPGLLSIPWRTCHEAETWMDGLTRE